MDEMLETHTDFAGRPRHFAITLIETPGGILAEAIEQTKTAEGYRFSAVGPSGNPAVALAALRRKLYQVINTRHLDRQGAAGARWITHDVIRGRIASDTESGQPVIVVDGEALSWEDFGAALLTHEGFDFELRLLE